MKLNFTLNGREVTTEVAADDVLLDVVRGLGLLGTKEGCAVGVCGACSLLVAGRPVSGCLFLAPCAEGEEVWTVEGLTAAYPALLEAFVEAEAMQCGICTPGQVVATFACVAALPDASEEEVRAFMAGNLCRCTGYASIVDAVERYRARR